MTELEYNPQIRPLEGPPESGVPELIGVGSPLVDLVLRVEDAFLHQHVGGAKGGMEFIAADAIDALIALSGAMPAQSPGGSAANITVGCAELGMRSAFIGCCGADALGEYYCQALTAQGCQPRIVDHIVLPTGRVLSLVTPEGERTMRTCLGAAAALEPAHVAPAAFAGARLVMMEGYSLYNHELARGIARAATEAGCQLALDLSAFEVVEANRDVIAELLAHHVDVVFANRDEALVWNPSGVEAALAEFAHLATVAVVKLGKEGAIIRRGDELVRVSAEVVPAIDTTGAGDCWAAAFLSGWLRGLPLAACGQLGSYAGAAVVQVYGGQMPRERWLGIKGRLDAWT